MGEYADDEVNHGISQGETWWMSAEEQRRFEICFAYCRATDPPRFPAWEDVPDEWKKGKA